MLKNVFSLPVMTLLVEQKPLIDFAVENQSLKTKQITCVRKTYIKTFFSCKAIMIQKKIQHYISIAKLLRLKLTPISKNALASV